MWLLSFTDKDQNPLCLGNYSFISEPIHLIDMVVSLWKMTNSRKDFPAHDVWALFIYSSNEYVWRISRIPGTVIDGEGFKNKSDTGLTLEEFRVQ